MEDCTDGDYWGTYRRFLERFISGINPEDQLPVKTNCYDVTDDELVGEVMYIALQYLDRKCCPLSLQTHIIHLVVDEVKKLCKEQPENCGWRADKKSYAPLKLMQTATGKVNEICRRYLDNSRLALLPPPYSTPLPLTSLYSIRHVRRKLEDRCTILHDLHGVFNIEDDIMASYFAIFDGHRGQDAAVYSAAHLHQYLVESENYPNKPDQALRDAILKTDEKFVEKDEELESNSGTTAVVALLMNNYLYVAWTGDSQAVLGKNSETISLVNPHSAASITEKARIEALGGMVFQHDNVWRVNGCISVARAIGDKQLKPFLTAEPDIVNVPLDGSEDFLILACDGFFDVVTPQEATRHLYLYLKDHHEEYREASQNLVELAKHKHSQDNISVIVVYLRAPADIAASESTRCKMSTRDEDFGFLKDDSQDIRKGPLSVEANLMFPSSGLMFPKSTNGQHENGAIDVGEDDDDDEDDEDLGPETNVDTVDDATEYVPANIVINRDLFQQKLEQENGQDDMIQINDVQNDTKAPVDEKADQNAYIVADADNVADSEDSEDEWNYYPNEEKESAGAPSAPEECQPETQQNQTDLPEQAICESKIEGNAESFELIDTNISDNDCPEPSKPEQLDQSFTNLIDTDEKDDMAFNLNPNAAEFVPVATNRSPPKIADRVMADFPISGSPLKRSNLMDDMPIPSEMEFQREVRRRPHELEHDTSYSENENDNDNDNENENDNDINHDVTTEISSVKAEYGDSFFTDNTRNDGSFITDVSFTDSDKYDIAKDPMAMSLTPGDLKLALEVNDDENEDDSKHETDSENGNLLEPSVDLNAVHELRDADLLGENNENMMNEWNKENCPPAVESTESNAELLDNQVNDSELLNGDDGKACALKEEELAAPVEKDSLPEPEREPVLANSLSKEEIEPFEMDSPSQEETKPVEADSPLQEEIKPEEAVGFSYEEMKPAEADGFSYEEMKPAEADGFSCEEMKSAEAVGFSYEEAKPAEAGGFSCEETKPAEAGGFSCEETKPAEAVGFSCEETKPAEAVGFSQHEIEPVAADSPVDSPMDSPVDSPLQEEMEPLQSVGFSQEAIEHVEAESPSQEEIKPVQAVDFSPIEMEPAEAESPSQEEMAPVQAVDFSPIEMEPAEADTPSQEEMEHVQAAGFSREEIEPVNAVGFSREEIEPVEAVGFAQEDLEPERITPTEKMDDEAERGSPEPHSEDSTTCPIETKEQFEMDVCASNDPCKTNSEDASPLDSTVPYQMSMDEPLVNESLNNVSLMLTEKMESLNLHDTTAEFEKKEAEILKEYLVTEQKDVEEKKEEIVELAKEFEIKPLDIEPSVPLVAPFVEEKVAAAANAEAATAKTSPKKIINKTAPPKSSTAAATKTTKSLTSSAKSSAKTSPTSPTKTEKGPSTAARTSTSAAAKKPISSSAAAKPKVLDTKPAARTVATTKTSTSAAKPLAAKTSVAAVKSKVGSVGAAKPAAEKKLTNGEVKSAVSKVGAAPKTTARLSGSSATKISPLVKATATKSTAPVPKPRPTSAVSSTTTTKSTARTTSLTSASSARPKTASSVTSSTTTSTVKARSLSGQSKAPMIDKQIKETANKQISSARSTASATSRTSTTTTTTRMSTNSTNIRRVTSATTTAKTTAGATSPTKKPVGSKISATKTNSAASKTSVTKTSVIKTKTLQNGDCDNAQKNEIIKTTTIEEDVPKKDVSPIITPTDNQLITTEE